ncbi:MAG: ABC transporter permease [Chloroflexi bacterium]|nr:ABC transporter permease [Chloroflexota bacterium]
MLLRILRETLFRRKKRVTLAILAVLIGSSLATALLSVSNDILDRVTKEMRSYGANILLTPESESLQLEFGGVSIAPEGSQGLIDEDELIGLKTIFWRNNVTGFAPFLNLMVTVPNGDQLVLTGTWFDKELTLPKGSTLSSGTSDKTSASEAVTFKTGVRSVSPWWKVKGDWVNDADPDGAIVGSSVAERLGVTAGDKLVVTHGQQTKELRVAGVVTSGGYEDNQVFVSLPTAQGLLGISKGASRVLVSALTMPKEKLAPDIRNKRPEEMTPVEYEKWYCSPIIDAVATQIKEVLPGVEAKPIRQISEAEGSFAVKVQLLIFIVTAAALMTSALGVMTTMTAAVLERQGEIGLMKAIGAENLQVATLFLAEGVIIGLVGGIFGFAVGHALSGYIGIQVFNVNIEPSPMIFPVSILLAVGVALLGSAIPVHRAVRVEPVRLLRQTGGVE